MAYPYYMQQPGPGRSAAVDELMRAFPNCRALNTERSALDLPIEIQPGRQTALRITMPPMFPQERPSLTVLVPVHNPAVDSSGRLRCRALEEWDCRTPGKASVVAAVREALALLTRTNPTGMEPTQGPSSGGGSRPADSPSINPTQLELESLSTAELEKLLTDDEAFRTFVASWIKKTPAASTLEEIQRQNVALAQDNLSMQGSIEEARNHVAVVRSSEFASVKSRFDELYQRQEAALAKLSPVILYQKLKDEAEKLDDSSSACEDSFLEGKLSVEQFVEQYLQQRIEHHKLDIVRQATDYTSNHLPQLEQMWGRLA